MRQFIEVNSIVTSESVYFQFPIRALNLGKNINKVTEEEASKRLQLIVDYCLVDYGTKNSTKAGRDHANTVASNYIQNNELTYDFNKKKPLTTPQQAAVFFAADRLNVSWPKGTAVDLSWIYDSHGAIANLLGGNMQVRLRSDVFWDLACMGWREWSILCGIYGMLGNRSKVRLCYKQINALALGFNSVTQIGTKLDQLRMTDRQTQYTVDKLAGRILLSKFSINCRHNWYSHKPKDELEKMMIDSEVHKQKRRIRDSASEATARGRAEVLRQLEEYKKDSAKAELERLKNKSNQVGKV
jgi:hypothetical protein